MGPKNGASNWHYIRFGTISDGTITGMHCIIFKKFHIITLWGIHSVHWISLSTRDMGLEQIRAISDSRCKRRSTPRYNQFKALYPRYNRFYTAL